MQVEEGGQDEEIPENVGDMQPDITGHPTIVEDDHEDGITDDDVVDVSNAFNVTSAPTTQPARLRRGRRW
jgi:hypothetical protein